MRVWDWYHLLISWGIIVIIFCHWPKETKRIKHLPYRSNSCSGWRRAATHLWGMCRGRSLPWERPSASVAAPTVGRGASPPEPRCRGAQSSPYTRRSAGVQAWSGSAMHIPGSHGPGPGEHRTIQEALGFPRTLELIFLLTPDLQKLNYWIKGLKMEHSFTLSNLPLNSC